MQRIKIITQFQNLSSLHSPMFITQTLPSLSLSLLTVLKILPTKYTVNNWFVSPQLRSIRNSLQLLSCSTELVQTNKRKCCSLVHKGQAQVFSASSHNEALHYPFPYARAPKAQVKTRCHFILTRENWIPNEFPNGDHFSHQDYV